MQRTILAKYVPNDTVEDYNFGNIESEYSATTSYFLKDGKPFLPIMGEFHFSRCAEKDWETELLKIKANALDGVAVYVFWNHHEYVKSVFNFEGDRNIAKFLSICKKVGLLVALRIGPWCHGEVRFGGFPDWLIPVGGKRNDTPEYLKYVQLYWTELYKNVKEYLDGKTVIGIQLENEYQGKLEHIVTLRKIAEEIGFKTPFFTMTAWPTNAPDKRFLPMMGGYPEAPWTYHKRKLPPANRFAIVKGRTEAEIGEDLIKIKQDNKNVDFSAFPYSGCEVGTGNQVTQHRRPVISDKDGYGVAFAKFAAGMNWLGYYMYHGGRNPRGKMLQESRMTFYPNNYPIIDYDFQAPISKDGDVRKHGDRLRLMHLFIKTWDKDIARAQPYFAKEKGLPHCSVRINENSGYAFVTNYERGAAMEDTVLKMNLAVDDKPVNLPELLVPKEAIFFYPFNFAVENIKFDYITAQPITITKKGLFTYCYFMKIPGVTTKISINDEVSIVETMQEYKTDGGRLIFYFLEEDKALTLYRLNDKIIYANGEVYAKDKSIFACVPLGGYVTVDDVNINIPKKVIVKSVSLAKTSRKKLPFNHQLFSNGRRKYYELTVDKDLLEKYFDVKVIFNFVGLNMQVFSNGELIDDYFNTDGIYILHLKMWKEMLKKCDKLVFKLSPGTSLGIGNVYNEINIPNKVISLEIKEIVPIYQAEIKA